MQRGFLKMTENGDVLNEYISCISYTFMDPTQAEMYLKYIINITKINSNSSSLHASSHGLLFSDNSMHHPLSFHPHAVMFIQCIMHCDV